MEICDRFFNQSLVIVCHGTIREEESKVVAFVMLPGDVGGEGSVAETKTNERKTVESMREAYASLHVVSFGAGRSFVPRLMTTASTSNAEKFHGRCSLPPPPELKV